MTSHARKHMRRMLGKNFDRVPSQVRQARFSSKIVFCSLLFWHVPLMVLCAVLKVVSHAHQAEEMQHMASLASSGVMGSHPSLTSNFSSMMEENDDYVDYSGVGSPLGLSSESSNPDRSCTSTPVGNDSSPAGESILTT